MELKDSIDRITSELIQESDFRGNQILSQVIRDINESENDNESYAYLPLNSEAELPMIKLIGIRMLLSNMLDGGVVDPNKIQLGTTLLYSTGQDDKMQSVIFDGGEVVSGIQRWKLISPNKRGPSRGLKRSIDTESFEKHISIATNTSTIKLTDNRKQFADYVGLKQYSRTDDKHYIVLAPSSILNKIRTSKIKFGKHAVDFGALVYSQLLKSTGAFENVRRTHHSFTPFLLLASNAKSLSGYLIDNPSTVDRIYIIGDKWWSERNELWISTIVSIARESSIPLTVFSPVGSVMTPYGMETIEKLPEIYAWFDNLNDCTPAVRIEVITDSEENMQAWNDIIDITRQWQDEMSVVALINWFLIYKRIYFSNINTISATKDMMFERIQDALKSSSFDIEAQEHLQNDMTNLNNGNYAISLDNKINEIGCGSDTLIVAPKYTFKELQDNLRRRGKCATVITYSEEINHSFYDSYRKIILIDPRAFERRKWLMAGLGILVVIVYPSLFWLQNRRSLKSDLSFIQEINKRDYLQDGGTKKIVSEIKTAMKNTNKKLKINGEIAPQLVDESPLVVEEFNDDLNDFKLESLPSGKKLMRDVSVENDAKVIATYLVKLSESKDAIVLGTPHGKVPIRLNDRLERVAIGQLSSGDTIAYVKMDDCIDVYRKTLQQMTNNDIFRKQKFYESANTKLDYEWKHELLNYVMSNRLSPQQLKMRFERFGYMRSVGFYQSWSNVKKINFVPRDMDFIGVVGEVCGLSKLKQNEEQYYQASIAVRDEFQAQRQEKLDNIESTSIKNFQYPVSFLTVDRVSRISKEINRSKTNCILENPEEELRE